MSTIEQHTAERTESAGGPQRLLLATDGGLAGVAAIRWIAERAAGRAMEVEAVRVLPGDGPDLTGAAAARMVDANGTMTEVRDLLHHLAPTVAVRTEVLTGDAVRTLQRRAEHADLVVVGTNRGARGIPHLVASFATRLADGCTRPMVVVPRGWIPSSGPIVLGAQGDGSDDGAIEFATAEANALGRHLVLVHAWRLAALAAPSGSVDLDRDAVEHAESDRLSELSDRIRTRHPDLRVAPVLDQDDPVRALVAASKGAALMVLGTHGLTAVDRLLLSSVSRELLERPACPIVVVPPAVETV